MDINEMARLALNADIDNFLNNRREVEDALELSEWIIDLLCPNCQYKFKDDLRIKFPECSRCKNIFER